MLVGHKTVNPPCSENSLSKCGARAMAVGVAAEIHACLSDLRRGPDSGWRAKAAVPRRAAIGVAGGIRGLAQTELAQN
jgi:hypothetical protein